MIYPVTLYYHVVRVREAGLKENNPVIAYYGVTASEPYADRLANEQPSIGGTYCDVLESDSAVFGMDWLASDNA